MKALILIAAICLGVQSLDLINEQWKSFKLTYSKQYYSETEENSRMKIFMDNLHMIEAHNQKYELGLVSYNLTMNQFGDLSLHEIRNSRINKLMPLQLQDEERVTFIEPADVELPDFIDWREKGAVTPVKTQGTCSSCYSFSVTGAVEGQHFLKTGQLVSLSEQNLVDCTRSYDTSWTTALTPKALTHPYEDHEGKCRYNPKTVGATIKGYVNIKSGSEKQLQVAVATIGPVSVGIDGNRANLYFYHGGVYDDPTCGNTIKDIGHAVLVVGYGTTNDGKDYWIVKNSDGPKWGDNGYVLMSRNKHNQCGIATRASYPVV